MNPNNNQNLPFLQQLKETKSKINTLVIIIFLTIVFTIIGVLIYFFIIKDEPLSPLVITPEPTALSSELVDLNDVSSSTDPNTPTPTNMTFTPTPTDSYFIRYKLSFFPSFSLIYPEILIFLISYFLFLIVKILFLINCFIFFSKIENSLIP